MTKEKAKFFAGLGLLVSLLLYSLLRQQQATGWHYALVFALPLAALAFDYLKVSQFLALAKEYESRYSHDVAMRTALVTTLKSPLLAKLLGTELLTLYYAFFAKAAGGETVSRDRAFSYVKSSNAHDVFLFVALSQLPFLPFVHVFVEYQIGPAPAWVITAATLWSVVWYQAQVEAVKLRPIELSADFLMYRFGLLWNAEIPLRTIREARTIGAAEVLSANDFFLSPLGSAKNVLLEFETPVRFSGPYGQRRTERKAAISLDDPSRFLDELACRGVAIGE